MGTLSVSQEFGNLENILAANSSLLKGIKALSGIQVALGCVSLVAQGIFTGIILTHLQPELRHFLVSFGVWAGILFIATGIIGLRLRKTHFVHIPEVLSDSRKQKHSRSLPISFIVISIFSSFAAATLFALNIINLLWLGQRPIFYAPHFIFRHADIYLFQPLTVVLAATGVIQLVITIVAACLCGSIRSRYNSKNNRYSSSSLRRIRSFIDYPSATLDSLTAALPGSLGRRVRSYSQSSLMNPPVPTRTGRAPRENTARSVSRPVLPVNFATGPPPSYDEAWDGIDVCHAVPVQVSRNRERRENRSNARVYQNLQTSLAASRASF